MKYSKLKDNFWTQRNIFTNFLETLVRIGMDREQMSKAFPNWNNIDIFIQRYGSREAFYSSLLND